MIAVSKIGIITQSCPQTCFRLFLYARKVKPKILTPLAFSDEARESPRYFARTVYASSVEKAGGIPLFLSRPNGDELEELAKIMDGLIIMGGVDPHPRLYGEEVLPSCGRIDEERDALELALCAIAVKKRIPILGLCRGFQVINIHFGGTLYQDIPEQFSTTIRHESHAILERKRLMHTVDVLPGTILSDIFGLGPIEVNSIHHQGIKVLGQGLKVSARSPDGLIEGIEHPDLPFCVGTQWHPEEFTDKSSTDIFRRFVECAQVTPHGTSS